MSKIVKDQKLLSLPYHKMKIDMNMSKMKMGITIIQQKYLLFPNLEM